MALAIAQKTNGGSGAASVSSKGVTWVGNTTTGNLIVVIVGYFDDGHAGPGLVSTITDSQSNVYVSAIIPAHNSNMGCEIWYAKNITGGTTPTVTVNFSATARPSIFLYEYSGADTTSPLDQVNSAIGSASPYSVTTPSTTVANEVVIAGGAMNQTAGNSGFWGSGTGYGDFQSRGDQGTAAAEDKFVSAIGAQTATFVNQNFAAVFSVATFKEASSGVTTIPDYFGGGQTNIRIQDRVTGY